MYGKIFDSIFDSTLVAEGGWLPTYIFMSMVAIADKDGYVELAPKVLFTRLGFRGYDNKIDYKDFEAAIEFLSQADSYSKTPDFEGRRIIPVSDLPDIEGNRGYWIVNYDKYRKMASREDRANKSTERSRKWREKHNKNNNETQGDAQGRRGRHTDTDTDTDTDTKTCIRKKIPPSLDDVKKYCHERGNSVDPEKFMNHYDSVNWMKGKAKVKDWQACVRTWEQKKKTETNDDYTRGAI